MLTQQGADRMKEQIGYVRALLGEVQGADCGEWIAPLVVHARKRCAIGDVRCHVWV
jgi:hypothetical protein